MEVRLQKATRLLRDPQAKVINVAASAGFNHLSLFNSCFRRRFGVSPSQWRKTILNAAPELTFDAGILPMLAREQASPEREPVAA
jgi:AraC-like DNA-binding protein